MNLQRNLSAFGLSTDPVCGDGDCAFLSIIRQLYKSNLFRENGALRDHLESIELCINEEDAFTLRQLFVDNVQSNDHYQLLVGIPAEKLNDETELFRERFSVEICGNIGDLVVRVCSDVLRVPVLVITSLCEHPYISFIPDDVVVMSSLFVAYNGYGPGHYDSTLTSVSASLEDSSKLFCSCGKNKSRGNTPSCDTSKNLCPCVQRQVSCTRCCCCRNCCNKPEVSQTVCGKVKYLSCRCGQYAARKNGDHALFCKDNSKKSRCPCLGNQQGCSRLCKCINCGNIHGSKSVKSMKSTVDHRKREKSSYKKVKSCEFLASSGFSPSGPWTHYETTLLASVLKFVSLTVITPSADNVSKLYNYVATSSYVQSLKFKPRSKTSLNISAKLAHLGQKQEVVNARMPTSED